MKDVTRRNVVVTGVSAVLGVSAAQAAGAEEEAAPDRWRAWAVTEGDDTRLVVEGIYTNGGPGKVVILKDAVPQGINPKILILRLKTAVLPGIWPTIVQPIPAWYVKTPYKKGRYTSITIIDPDDRSVNIDRIIEVDHDPAI